jgi:hypothetical protein
MIKAEVKLESKQFTKLYYLLQYSKLDVILIMSLGVISLIQLILYFSGGLKPASQPDEVDAIFVAVLFLGPFFMYSKAQNRFLTDSLLKEPVRYEFLDDKIKMNGASFLGEIDWSNINKVKVLKHWFILYRTKNSMLVIPKSALDEQLSDFEALVKSKGY